MSAEFPIDIRLVVNVDRDDALQFQKWFNLSWNYWCGCHVLLGTLHSDMRELSAFVGELNLGHTCLKDNKCTDTSSTAVTEENITAVEILSFCSNVKRGSGTIMKTKWGGKTVIIIMCIPFEWCASLELDRWWWVSRGPWSLVRQVSQRVFRTTFG